MISTWTGFFEVHVCCDVDAVHYLQVDPVSLVDFELQQLLLVDGVVNYEDFVVLDVLLISRFFNFAFFAIVKKSRN